MILFLNFAPLNFGGGAERWMMDVATEVSKSEKVTLVDVHQNLSNIYGKLVLKRPYDARLKLNLTENQKHLSLKFWNFVPFTSQWRQAKQAFDEARRIYIRFEILETAIVLYFGGLNMLKKTIAGIHSPFLYASPIGFFGHLHNSLYGSSMSTWLLKKMKIIHVITPVDEDLFTKKMSLQNTVYVPNFIATENTESRKTEANNQKLSIAFVGELNMRKGVDILIETIKKSPLRFFFHIIGDGTMKKDTEKLLTLPNISLHGFLNKEALTEIYQSADILFLPSRAESFSLAFLEAMAHGLVIVSSTNTRIGLPPFVQQTAQTPDEYIQIFERLEKDNQEDKLTKRKKQIQEFTQKNFSEKIVMKKLLTEIFGLKSV